MGLINQKQDGAAAPDAKAPATAPPENPLLAETEKQIESQLTPENRADYLRVVTAGMKAGLEGGPKSILASLRNSKDPVRDCAVGAVRLALVLYKQSRRTMPLKAMIPGAMTLMLKALDFADKAGIAKIGRTELVQASHIFANELFRALRITPQMLQTAAQKVHALSNDPSALERMKRAAGAVRDPRASTPVGQPEGQS